MTELYQTLGKDPLENTASIQVLVQWDAGQPPSLPAKWKNAFCLALLNVFGVESGQDSSQPRV